MIPVEQTGGFTMSFSPALHHSVNKALKVKHSKSFYRIALITLVSTHGASTEPISASGSSFYTTTIKLPSYNIVAFERIYI